jgi:hypothetical protein
MANSLDECQWTYSLALMTVVIDTSFSEQGIHDATSTRIGLILG